MIKVLHVASFVGNIGDNASHLGLYQLLAKLLPAHQITQLEMRRFYQQYTLPDKAYFDRDFVDLVNRHDLVIIGGGGFLDYWHKNSQSGTTIDIDPELLQFVTTPTLICSMGAMALRPVPEGNVAKARKFFSALQANPWIRVAVRNDGSLNSIERDLGADCLSGIAEILDHGFFYQPPVQPGLPVAPFVALNITEDQLTMQRSSTEPVISEQYYTELRQTLEHIVASHQLKVVLVPHIYSDLRAINQLLLHLDDWFVRQHITVAPCIQGDAGADYLFNLYRQSKLVIGMRFHTNVCSLAMGLNVIGLVALDRINYLYQSLGDTESCVSVTGEFAAGLIQIIDHKLAQANAGVRRELLVKQTETTAFYTAALSQFGVIK